MATVLESSFTVVRSRGATYVNSTQTESTLSLDGVALSTPSVTDHTFHMLSAIFTLRDTRANGGVDRIPLDEIFDLNKQYKVLIVEEEV